MRLFRRPIFTPLVAMPPASLVDFVILFFGLRCHSFTFPTFRESLISTAAYQSSDGIGLIPPRVGPRVKIRTRLGRRLLLNAGHFSIRRQIATGPFDCPGRHKVVVSISGFSTTGPVLHSALLGLNGHVGVCGITRSNRYFLCP